MDNEQETPPVNPVVETKIQDGNNVQDGEKKVNSSRWKPGQSGNPNGRPRKGTSWKSILEDAVKEIEPKSGKILKEFIAKRLVLEAANGNLDAFDKIIRLTEGYQPVKSQQIPYDEDAEKSKEELKEELEALERRKQELAQENGNLSETT